MPKNSPIKANTIDDVKLPPHLRNNRKGFNVTIHQQPLAVVNKYYALTTIQMGELVYLEQDGRLNLADMRWHHAEFIALNSGSQGDLITVNSIGTISIELDLGNNTAVYLSSNGDLASTPPTSKDSIFQHIGVYSSGVLKYNINNWYIIE